MKWQRYDDRLAVENNESVSAIFLYAGNFTVLFSETDY